MTYKVKFEFLSRRNLPNIRNTVRVTELNITEATSRDELVNISFISFPDREMITRWRCNTKLGRTVCFGCIHFIYTQKVTPITHSIWRRVKTPPGYHFFVPTCKKPFSAPKTVP